MAGRCAASWIVRSGGRGGDGGRAEEANLATQLFLRDAAEGRVSVGSFDERKLATTRGSVANATDYVRGLEASGNHLTIIHGGTAAEVIWLFRVNAVTIASTITFNFWGMESAMTANAQLAVVVGRWDSSGFFVSDVVGIGNANHADGVELGTSLAAMNWTATPTSTTFATGDWLGVHVQADAIGTMGTGSVTISIDGPTAGVSGDSFVTFTENFTEFVPAILGEPRRRLNSQLLAHTKAFEPPPVRGGLWLPNRRLVLA